MPAKTKKFEDSTMYDVVFSKVVPSGPVKFRPCNRYQVKGRVLNGLDPAAIDTATPSNDS